MNCLLSNPPICLFELYLVKKTINPLNEINVVDAHGLCVHYPPSGPRCFIHTLIARHWPGPAIHYFG